LPILWLLFQIAALILAETMGWPVQLLNITVSLLTARLFDCGWANTTSIVLP